MHIPSMTDALLPCLRLFAGMAALLAACPTFETFWQGRLIPGTCVDTLPFIRAVRCKRSAAAKDLLPDDVFSRIRCAGQERECPSHRAASF